MKTITIEQETKIPGTDYVLEAGDRITIKEQEETEEIVKDLIDTKWSKDDDSAGKAVNLLKGLAFSDDEKAKQFIKDLDELTSTLDAEDYKSE